MSPLTTTTPLYPGLAEANWGLALHPPHALRGTAASLGAMTLHDAAHTLETVLCT